MTTVFEVSLEMMRHVTDMLNGTATGGSTTTLEDTLTLVQPNEYWKRGTLWVRSGTHAGKVLMVSDYAENELTVETLASALAAGVRYSVASGAYPWEQIRNAIQTALDETYILDKNNSLEGDGESYVFALPEGVSDLIDVRFTRTMPGWNPPSHHWAESMGSLVFEYGFAPMKGDGIELYYKARHAEIVDFSTAINPQINRHWLTLAAAREMLFWGAQQYNEKPEMMIEQRLNKVLGMLKGKVQRLGSPLVRMKSAGGGRDYSASITW